MLVTELAQKCHLAARAVHPIATRSSDGLPLKKNFTPKPGMKDSGKTRSWETSNDLWMSVQTGLAIEKENVQKIVEIKSA